MDSMVVFIVSWDAYWPCNEPMYKMMHFFWHGCRFPFYLCTKKKCETEGEYDRYIYASQDEYSWTGLLRDYLTQINEEYVFFLLVDQWPTDEIDSQAIEDAVDLLKNNADVGVVYFRESLNDFRTSIPFSSKGYVEVPFGESYRLCATPAVWRRKDLLMTCKQDFSAWEFERKVSFAEYTKYFRVLVDCRANVYKYFPAGAILKSKWVREAVSYSDKYGLNVDFTTLPILSQYETWKWRVKSKIFDLNPKMVVWIQNIMERNLLRRA